MEHCQDKFLCKLLYHCGTLPGQTPVQIMMSLGKKQQQLCVSLYPSQKLEPAEHAHVRDAAQLPVWWQNPVVAGGCGLHVDSHGACQWRLRRPQRVLPAGGLLQHQPVLHSHLHLHQGQCSHQALHVSASTLRIIIIIIAVISIAPYLTDKGEHTTLYKNNYNVYIKTSNIINYISHSIVFLACTHTHTHTHAHARARASTHTHTHTPLWY